MKTVVRQNAARWLAWWYLAICLGFLLLSIAHAISRDRPWLIAVRLIVAAGFGVLSWFEFKGTITQKK
jgi:hypothetical protein